MLKIFIAYGQIIVGVPLILAYCICYIPNYLIEKIWGDEKTSEYYYMAKTVIEGFLSVLAAYYLFKIIGVPISIWIPVTLTLISSLWRLSQNEGFMILFVNIGIIAGYKVFPYFQNYMDRW